MAACNDPPPSTAAVQSHITDDLGRILRESNAAAQTPVPGSSSLSLLGSLVPALSVSTGTSSAPLAALLPQLGSVGKSAGVDAVTGVDTDATIKYLNEKIFIDANRVGDGIYKIPAALACSQTTVDQNGGTTTTVNADCASKFDQAELRIRVEQDDAKLRFALQVDAAHDEPIALLLGHDALGISVNLDDTSKAIIALAKLTGSTAPNAALAGQITAELDILGTAHARASLTIDRDVSIKFADSGTSLESDGAFRLASAKARAFSVELDGNAKTAAFELGLGATIVAVPGTNPVGLDLAGLTAKAVLAAGQPLAVTHIGLGDRALTMSRNGKRAITIDLNPDNGRALDAKITAAATGEILEVTPKLDLRMAVDHAVLGDVRDVYDVTRVALEGSIRSAPTSGFAVATGSFVLATDPAAYGVTAAAGQCVSSTVVVDSTSGKTYDQWSAHACN